MYEISSIGSYHDHLQTKQVKPKVRIAILPTLVCRLTAGAVFYCRYNWKALFSECNLSRNTRPSTIVAAPNRTVLAGCGKPGVGQPTGKQYQKQRVHLAEDFYRKYNCIVFDNRLPEDTSITWSKRMTKKAGQAVLSSNPREGTKTARIELSEKVRQPNLQCCSFT